MADGEGIDGGKAPQVPRMIIGLGNPGASYRDTRHNIGFMVIDELSRRHGVSFTAEKRWSCLLAKFGGGWLVKPSTFMNASGDAVAAVSHFYRVPPSDLLVVYDDVDLPLGRVRLRPGGSAAGHNGLKSIISRLGTGEIPRLKVGIGAADGRPAGDRIVGHVLGAFRAEEWPAAEAAVRRAADAVATALRSGLEAAMNLFNRRDDAQTSADPPSPADSTNHRTTN